MRIEIPEEYRRYLELLKEYYTGADFSTTLSDILNEGLTEGEDDASMAGAPDGDENLIEYWFAAPKMTIEVPATSDQLARLERISRGYGFSVDRTATVVFLQGLFISEWLALRMSGLYKTDERFRNTVDEMPHAPCFENGLGEHARDIDDISIDSSDGETA
jgi:hypothetical protein